MCNSQHYYCVFKRIARLRSGRADTETLSFVQQPESLTDLSAPTHTHTHVLRPVCYAKLTMLRVPDSFENKTPQRGPTDATMHDAQATHSLTHSLTRPIAHSTRTHTRTHTRATCLKCVGRYAERVTLICCMRERPRTREYAVCTTHVINAAACARAKRPSGGGKMLATPRIS